MLAAFSPRSNAYGEVRFEEADGEYLVYLASNESFVQKQAVLDPLATPDTSGLDERCLAYLESGAAFPQEAYGSGQAVREQVGSPSAPSHENLGYKGQAILYPTGGRVRVEGVDPFTTTLTVQAFVKSLGGWSGELTLVELPGRFRLFAQDDGSLHAEITVKGTSYVQVEPGQPPPPAQMVRTLSTASGFLSTADAFQTGDGWRHVAFTYVGDTPSGSRFALVVDGETEDLDTWAIMTEFDGLPAASTVYVGPNQASGDTNPLNPVVILDEVAISRVVRTKSELRRDAYVAQDPDIFQAFPQQVASLLPLGLDPAEGKWRTEDPFDSTIPEKIGLGQSLFLSTQLSSDDAKSCSTCHVPSGSFVDGLTHGGIDTPTLVNAGFGGAKFFDGRAATLEEQAEDAILNELGLTLSAAATKLENGVDENQVPWLVRFGTAFGSQSVTGDRLTKALALYARSIFSGGSPFDQDAAYRQGLPGGSSSALTAQEQEGRALFFGKARCFGCHGGTNFSNDDFRNIGSVGPGAPTLGLGATTGRSSQEGELKVPSLRDIASTGPYFHDGSMATLEQVIDHYNDPPSTGFVGRLDRHLVSLELSPTEVQALRAFLESLSGSP